MAAEEVPHFSQHPKPEEESYHVPIEANAGAPQYDV
jgi:hypothetical protein